MRVWIILALAIGLVCGIGITPAGAAPKLEVSVGFGGYYRPETLTPVAVTIDNADGPTIRGELRIISVDFSDRMDRYRYPVTIARGATQQRFLNFIPSGFAHEMSVELWSDRRKLATGKSKRCEEIYGQDRLLAVVGGTGSTLHFVNSQGIKAPQEPFPRPWDLSRIEGWRQGYGHGGRPITMPVPGGGTTGKVNLTHIAPGMLPDNAEAYGNVDVLLLSSDVTENALSADAQKAIAVWVANGGHLMIAGGGVAARFNAPFYTGLLSPRKGVPLPDAEKLSNPAVGKGLTRQLGAGRVTLLDFDPDTVRIGNTAQAVKFFSKLVERNPLSPITASLGNEMQSSVEVNKLKPPNLTLIVLYLIVYLILLVPVNYFVLRRLDQRELAWLTTPAIVLIFTFGAYGIGYATKGNRLVFNIAGIMETAAGQRDGEVVSSLLLFSPVRTTYQLELGRDALLVRGYDINEQQYSPYGGYREPTGRPLLNVVQNDDGMSVDRVSVSQWAYRRFVTAYHVNLGGGFSADITPGAAGTSPRATGKVTNDTPFTFKSCLLYQDGALVAEFALGRGQTVDLAAAAGASGFKPTLSEDEQNIYDSLKNALTPQTARGGRLATGSVLVGFTTDSLAPAQLNRRFTVRTELNAVVLHL